MVGGPRIAGDRKGLGVVGRADGELREDEFPGDDGAGGANALRDDGVDAVAPGGVEDQGIGRRGLIRRGEDVFQPEGDALQRTAIEAGRKARVCLPCLDSGAGRVDG